MYEDIFWQAVKQNDKRFDGVFFTCVTSTKIFCRPSCPARLPKRSNVFFVDSPRTAENEGFRACLRCRPKQIEAVDEQVRKMIRACELIETEEDFSLEYLGKRLNLSSSHLQRTFKSIIGISPKKYGEQKRLEKFKHEVKKGRDVTESIYDAGFGSSSRLYENASEKLGMTPAVYRKGGEGMKIKYALTGCELGRLLVARTDKGLCGVKFADQDKKLVADLINEYPKADISEDERELKAYVKAILAHLGGKNPNLDLPLDVQATAFQMRVWEALRKIPFGTTRSYSEVAEKIGKPKAVRAVASACAKNRVALVIPCHRVVASNGKISGYRWGIERKIKLLKIEKTAATSKH